MPKESNEGESIDKAPSSKITITANIEFAYKYYFLRLKRNLNSKRIIAISTFSGDSNSWTLRKNVRLWIPIISFLLF